MRLQHFLGIAMLHCGYLSCSSWSCKSLEHEIIVRKRKTFLWKNYKFYRCRINLPRFNLVFYIHQSFQHKCFLKRIVSKIWRRFIRLSFMKRIFNYRFVTSRADFSTSPFGKLFRCFCRSIYAIGCCTICGFVFISSIWLTDNLFGCNVCHCLVINMSFVWLNQ